jgi:hypothetical protein
VNRLIMFVLGMALLFSSHAALGQHGGRGGSRGGAPRGTGSGGAADPTMADFNHALAVQATTGQVSVFQTLTKNTEAARKQAEDLARLAGKENGTVAFSQRTTALNQVLEDAQDGSQDFVKSFSKPQKAGLKEFSKKLEKADSEVAKQKKALDQQLVRAKSDGGAIASTADRLEKALAELQGQQVSLGKEMGIENTADVKEKAAQ